MKLYCKSLTLYLPILSEIYPPHKEPVMEPIANTLAKRIYSFWHLENGQWALGFFYTNPLKYYDNIFLFVGLTTVGTLIEFWLVGSLSITIEWLILCIIIGDVNQFMSHCLITLDPCHFRLINFYWYFYTNQI